MLNQHWKAKVIPREWQTHALARWIECGHHGVVSVVTGGGKTNFAHLCIQEFQAKQPTMRIIIIVPTLALLDQWYISLQEDLGVPDHDIVCFSGQEKSDKMGKVNLVVLNTARTLAASLASYPVTFLIVDECHRTGSPKNAKTLLGNHAATLGLSATPVREYDDGFDVYIKPALGDIIYEYDYTKALADRIISPFRLVNVRVVLLPDEKREYHRLTQAAMRAYRSMENHDGSEDRVRILLQRRAQISSMATMRIPVAAKIAEQHKGFRTIIFHERIPAANRLSTILRDRRQRPISYHSHLAPATRRDNLRLFRQGAFDILVTCRALDEGLNVPDIAVAIIASSTASERQRIQRLGRVLRPASGKDTALIYTLFATEAEKRRLRNEADRLEGATVVAWHKASHIENGTHSP